METLYKSGFAFLRDCGGGIIEFESKFTGLRLLYNTKSGERTVEGCAI